MNLKILNTKKKLELFNNKVLVVWYTFPDGRCWGSTMLHHHEIQNMRLEFRIWTWGSGKHEHLQRNQEGRSILSSSPRSLCSWGLKMLEDTTLQPRILLEDTQGLGNMFLLPFWVRCSTKTTELNQKKWDILVQERGPAILKKEAHLSWSRRWKLTKKRKEKNWHLVIQKRVF